MGQLRIIKTVETTNPVGEPVVRELKPQQQGLVKTLVDRLRQAVQHHRVPAG